MKKLITLVLAVLMVAVFVVGCTINAPATSPSDQPSDQPSDTPSDEPTDEFDPSEYSLAVCMGSMNHPVHRQVQVGFIKEAEKLGYKTPDIIGTDGSDQTEQFNAAKNWAAGVDSGKGGVLLWNGDHASDALCAELGEAGILVGIPHFRIFVDDDEEKKELPAGVSFEMACDPVAYGKAVAELAAKALDGKTGSFALTQNTKNSTENAATESFIAEFKALGSQYKLDGIKVLDVVLEGGEVEPATAKNLGIIQANKDIIGAFGTTGNSPVTWSSAAEKAGMKPGTELWIAGMDATDSNLALLKEGKVNVVVAQPLVQEAAKTAEYFDKLFRGETVPGWTDLQAGIVTVDATGENSIETWEGYAQQVAEYFKD